MPWPVDRGAGTILGLGPRADFEMPLGAELGGCQVDLGKSDVEQRCEIHT